MWRVIISVIAAATLGVAVLSLFPVDFGPLQIVNALSLTAALVAIVCAAAALGVGARRSALVLAIAGLAFAWPPVAAMRRAEEAVPSAGPNRLRVISFNAFRDNPTGESAARALAGLDGDVLLLQEAGGLGKAGLDFLARSYPHHSTCRAGCDLAIFARVPMDPPRWRFRDGAGAPIGARLVQATVRSTGQAPFTVVTVHLARPYLDPQGARAEFDELTQTIAQQAGAGTILTGDFNRAPWSPGMRAFEQATALRRAPTFDGTWPADGDVAGLSLPALAPIDHVFAGPAWLFGEGPRAVRLPGSDHRAVVVDLMSITPLPRAPASPRPVDGPEPDRPR